VAGPEIHRGPGRPRLEPRGIQVSVDVMEGPVAIGLAVNPTRPLAPIFQRRIHVPPVPHTMPNISSSQSLLPSQSISESQFLPQSDPAHSLADLQDSVVHQFHSVIILTLILANRAPSKLLHHLEK